MSEKNIGWSQLIVEVRNAHYDMEVCQCHYEKYLEWIRVDAEDLAQMEEIGKVFNDNIQEQSEPTVHHQNEYWGKDALMAFGYYPYYGCRLHKCLHCQRLFFVYREMGGHAGEVRCRYIREELLVFGAAKYSTKKQPPGSSNNLKFLLGVLIWVLIIGFVVRVIGCLAGSGH